MVKIVEFTQKFDDRLPFDVIDDVAIFMRNDPIFYRKQLFPAIMRMKDMYDAGKKPDAEKCLGEACNRAMESYCSKFKLGSKENVFKDEDRGLLLNKLYGEEMTQIRNGAY
jgi:hypothetical protein